MQSHLIDEAGRVIATASREDCMNASYWMAMSGIRTHVIDAWWISCS